MTNNKDYNKVQVLIVGAGPAGLAAAIGLKARKPEIQVCVIEKAADLGNHNLSGAVLEKNTLEQLLDPVLPEWQNTDQAKEILSNVIKKDNFMFMLGKNFAINVFFAIKIANLLKLGPGQMIHMGDYTLSISKLTNWLGQIAVDLGVEILTGFAAQDIILDQQQNVTAVKLVDQGLDKEQNQMPNFVPGETIYADFFILAEGCDGLITEKFIEKANLKRKVDQLYSVGIKELIKVSPQQYEKFGKDRVVHSFGFPLWTPVLGPAMFGGGIIYPEEQNHLALGIIVGADWKYKDFNPQDALARLKEHHFVKKFIEGGTVIEAGAKMIPEGGYLAIPRDTQKNTIGKNNCLILGDSAGLVNMLKIKGLHNAIFSGIHAAKAISESIETPLAAAEKYTQLIENSSVGKEMKDAQNYRQTTAKFGPLIGMPLSAFAQFLPKFKVEPDYQAMTQKTYKLKPDSNFDKDTFTALAATNHREEQPSHLKIVDTDICIKKCLPKFNSPCVTFCPGGVYENIHGSLQPANPSNCLHCKTCQRKCPFDNIRWNAPEGTGGPRYKRM